MASEHDRVDEAFTALYQGVVTAVADPMKIGRVKVRVPGVLEPESDWVLPGVTMGGGEARLGFFWVPPVGAEVSIWFLQGESDAPRYAPAHWGAPKGVSQAPTPVQDVTAEEAPLIRCLETESFLLTFDERPGEQSATLVHKKSGSGVIIDGVKEAIEINATVAVVIKSVGAITLEALSISLNGRPVLPGSKPI